MNEFVYEIEIHTMGDGSERFYARAKEKHKGFFGPVWKVYYLDYNGNHYDKIKTSLYCVRRETASDYIKNHQEKMRKKYAEGVIKKEITDYNKLDMMP